MRERTVKILLWAVTVLLLGGTLLWLWATGFFEAAASPEAMEEYIARCTPWSHLAYFAIQFASVIIAPIPSNITAAAAGWLFGVLPAFLLTVLCIAAGELLLLRALKLFDAFGFLKKLLRRKRAA